MRKTSWGFTLIELLVVLAIVATLLSIVAPRFLDQTDKAKEAALKENLNSLRIAIDRYYADQGQYPEQLSLLVTKRYLRKIPVDPITNRPDSWQLDMLDEEGKKVIYDIHSGATGQSHDGSDYGSW